MGGILIDSNILIRLLDKDSEDHASCIAAVTPENVDRFGLCMCAQSMIEFWVVCTRPRLQNGLGFTPTSLAMELERIESVIPCLSEPPDMAAVWRALVTRYHVAGKLAHDARMVAIMSAYGIRSLLTLNSSDFARYQGVQCVSPAMLLATPL